MPHQLTQQHHLVQKAQSVGIGPNGIIGYGQHVFKRLHTEKCLVAEICPGVSIITFTPELFYNNQQF